MNVALYGVIGLLAAEAGQKPVEYQLVYKMQSKSINRASLLKPGYAASRQGLLEKRTLVVQYHALAHQHPAGHAHT